MTEANSERAPDIMGMEYIADEAARDARLPFDCEVPDWDKRYRTLPSARDCGFVFHRELPYVGGEQFDALLRRIRRGFMEWPDPTARRDVPSTEEHALATLERAIDVASQSRSPEAALREIEQLWSDITKVTGLAEATMRRLLAKCDKPPRVAAPPWLTHDIDEILTDEERPLPEAIKSMESLVRAVLHRVGGSTKARLAPGPRGAVEVVWDTPFHLRWLVHPPILPWPGVNVRLYARPDPALPQLKARSAFLAETVLEHATRYLGDGDASR